MAYLQLEYPKSPLGAISLVCQKLAQISIILILKGFLYLLDTLIWYTLSVSFLDGTKEEQDKSKQYECL